MWVCARAGVRCALCESVYCVCVAVLCLSLRSVYACNMRQVPDKFRREFAVLHTTVADETDAI